MVPNRAEELFFILKRLFQTFGISTEDENDLVADIAENSELLFFRTFRVSWV